MAGFQLSTIRIEYYPKKGIKHCSAHWGEITSERVISRSNYRTRAIITRGLYTFYPFFEIHLCTVTFGLMYG